MNKAYTDANPIAKRKPNQFPVKRSIKARPSEIPNRNPVPNRKAVLLWRRREAWVNQSAAAKTGKLPIKTKVNTVVRVKPKEHITKIAVIPMVTPVHLEQRNNFFPPNPT